MVVTKGSQFEEIRNFPSSRASFIILLFIIMEQLSQLEKLQITLDIVHKLKTFEGPNGKANLFNESYSFIKELKKIFNDYIHSDRIFKGRLEFKEIDKFNIKLLCKKG